MDRKIFCLLSVLVIFGLSSTRVLAVALPPEPTFPSCLNPQGTLSVSYPDGTHGIPGDEGNYTGSDKVYSLNDQSLTQCFCATDGRGIQTNWWKTGDLGEEQIAALKSQGWILIPDGSLWGLEKTGYMAKSANYSCNGNGGTGGGSTNNSSDNGTGGGEILSATTSRYGQVLGLATTGGLKPIVIDAILGFVLLFLARKIAKAHVSPQNP